MLAFNIFELLGKLFNLLFIPLEHIRLVWAKGEAGWWVSNAFNWVFVLILILLLGYWISQAIKFKREGTEDRA